MTQSTGNTEPHEGIDAFDNPETRASEREQTSGLARSSGDGGAPATEAPAAGEAPEVAGTGAGDPLAGVRISPEEADGAVSGDTGPEHPGTRRSS
jgi:hypothetical protein